MRVTLAQTCSPISEYRGDWATGSTAVVGNNNHVYQTDVAGGKQAGMAVFVHDKDVPNTTPVINFSFGVPGCTLSPMFEGDMPTSASVGMTTYTPFRFDDPSVAYDLSSAGPDSQVAETGKFLCVARARRSNDIGLQRDVLLASLFTPGANSSCSPGYSGTWTNWVQIFATPLHDVADEWMLHPFLVAGQSNGEFYVTWMHKPDLTSPFVYASARTTSLASWPPTWVIDNPIGDADFGGTTIPAAFAIQPSVYGTGHMYIAFSSSLGVIEFLEGQDNSTTGGVTYRRLRKNNGSVISIPLRIGDPANLNSKLPGRQTTYTAQVAVDPSNANRIYVVYEDVRDVAGSTDVDVFSRTVDKRGTYWVLGPEVSVPGLPTPPLACPTDTDLDQYLGAIAVDTLGTLHVIYYDDRLTCQTDLVSDGLAAYNLTYAASCDGGQTYSLLQLTPLTTGDVYFLDYTKDSIPFHPHEYIGIETNTLASPRVWISFTGTTDLDELNQTPRNRSTIHGFFFGW